MIKAHLLTGDINSGMLEQIEICPVYFPQEWNLIIKGQSDTFKKRFNLDALGNKIRMKHPGAVAYNVSESALSGNSPWLYVIEKKEKIEDLEVLAIDWLLNKADQLGVKLDKEVEASLLSTHLTYGNEINLDEKLSNPSIIEGLSAYLYSKDNKTFCYGEEVILGYKTVKDKKKTVKGVKPKQVTWEFFHAFSGQVHEAISEPIHLEGDYVSLVLTFTYATIPITKERKLVIHPSFRRWVFGEEGKIELKGSHSLYIRKKTSAKASFYRFAIKKVKGKSIFRNEEEELFNQLVRNSISLDEVLQNPKKYMEHDEYFIGIPYGENSFGGSHNVGSGVEQQLKKAIYENLLEEFDFFKSMDPLQIDKKEGEQKIYTSKLHQGKDEKKEKDRRTVHFDFADYKGKTNVLNLAIWEDGDSIKNEFRDVIENSMIGFTKITDDSFLIQTANNRKILLNINHHSKGNFDRKMKDNGKREKAGRKEEVRGILENCGLEMGTFCLIEMKNYQKTVNPEGDPKNVIRDSFQSLGYKTQFIEPLKKVHPDMKKRIKDSVIDGNHVRLEKAFLDILSKSGFISKMENFEVNLYGFNVLKVTPKDKTVNVPVLARVTDEAKEYHFLNNDGWVSEEEILFKLNDVLNEADEGFDWSSTERKLNDILSQDKNHKLLTLSASLRYRFIPQIRNGEISENLFLLNQVPKLSICRINHNRDVPGYYLYNQEKGETTKTKGIIQINDYLFYSIGQKPDTDTTGKLTTHFSDKKKKHQQRRLAEILILSNTDRNKLELARIIHNSRDLTLTTNYHTKEAFCLYMIDNLKEYLP